MWYTTRNRTSEKSTILSLLGGWFWRQTLTFAQYKWLLLSVTLTSTTHSHSLSVPVHWLLVLPPLHWYVHWATFRMERAQMVGWINKLCLQCQIETVAALHQDIHVEEARAESPATHTWELWVRERRRMRSEQDWLLANDNVGYCRIRIGSHFVRLQLIKRWAQTNY